MGHHHTRPFSRGVCSPTVDGCPYTVYEIDSPCLAFLRGGRDWQLLFIETFRHWRGTLLQSVCAHGRPQKMSVSTDLLDVYDYGD